MEEKPKTFEDLPEIIPEDIGLIGGIIERLKNKLEQVREKRKEEEWFKTPEGIKWLAQKEERKEAQKRYEDIAAKNYAEKMLEAKRQLALEIEADILIKKHKIQDNDLRLQKIRYDLDRIQDVVSASYYRR